MRTDLRRNPNFRSPPVNPVRKDRYKILTFHTKDLPAKISCLKRFLIVESLDAKGVVGQKVFAESVTSGRRNRDLVPCPAIQDPPRQFLPKSFHAAFAGPRFAPQLEMESHSGSRSLVANIRDPFRLHRAGSEDRFIGQQWSVMKSHRRDAPRWRARKKT